MRSWTRILLHIFYLRPNFWRNRKQQQTHCSPRAHHKLKAAQTSWNFYNRHSGLWTLFKEHLLGWCGVGYSSKSQPIFLVSVTDSVLTCHPLLLQRYELNAWVSCGGLCPNQWEASFNVPLDETIGKASGLFGPLHSLVYLVSGLQR